MKYYAFWDGPEDKKMTVISEVEILEFYWDYWNTEMRKIGKYEQINPQNCIEDFCVVHWASETHLESINNLQFKRVHDKTD